MLLDYWILNLPLGVEMKKVLCGLVVALTALIACNEEDNSSVKLVDSNYQVFELSDGSYGEALSVNKARINFELLKDGRIDYTIRAEMSIADIVMQEFSFKRVYKMNPRFARYSTYATEEQTWVYSENGKELAQINKIGEIEGGLRLHIYHYETGLTAAVRITEGDFGLVNVKEVVLSGEAMVNVKDPQGRTESKFVTDQWGWGYYAEVPLMLQELFNDTVRITAR